LGGRDTDSAVGRLPARQSLLARTRVSYAIMVALLEAPSVAGPARRRKPLEPVARSRLAEHDPGAITPGGRRECTWGAWDRRSRRAGRRRRSGAPRRCRSY